jgi:hypothetical protein
VISGRSCEVIAGPSAPPTELRASFHSSAVSRNPRFSTEKIVDPGPDGLPFAEMQVEHDFVRNVRRPGLDPMEGFSKPAGTRPRRTSK